MSHRPKAADSAPARHADHAPILPRPRLLRRIQQRLQAGPVCLIAPPGYGKSVLLRDYVAHQPGATLINLHPESMDLTILQARVATVPATAPLIVDDVHHLEDAPETTAWLGEEIGRRTRSWLVAGRTLPPSLTTHCNDHTLITAPDLALTPAESDHLLQLRHGTLSPTARQDWHTYTDGWPLAISLAAQAVTLPPAPSSTFSSTFSYAESQHPAAHVPNLDPLLHQLLADLPPPIRQFLLHSALPARINHVLYSDLLGVTRTEAARQLAETVRRNLFLHADEQPGWYRYHDLIRERLYVAACAHYGPDVVDDRLRRCAAWFHAHDDIPQAVEHALLAHDAPLAASYMRQLPPSYLWDRGIFRTYQRWVAALDEPTQAANPSLLVLLGRARLDIGDRGGARRWLRRAFDFARRADTSELVWEAQTALAKLHNMEGELSTALALCADIIDQAPPAHPAHLQALNASGNAYTQLNRFRAARGCFEQALSMASSMPVQSMPTAEQHAHARLIAGFHHNLVMGVHIPLGQFEAALKHLRINDLYYAQRPVARSMHLLAWCAFHEAVGDWAGLAQDLAEIEAAEAQSEHPDEENIWYFWYRALYYTGVGEYMTAQEILDALRPMMVSDEDMLCLAYAQVWLLRRTRQWDVLLRVARETFATVRVGPLYRGMIALEMYQAHLEMQREGTPSVDPMPDELVGLLRARAAPWLFRLHAHLASACSARTEMGLYTQRRKRRALALAEQKFFWRILVWREPELGLRFWTQCLADASAPARALTALTELASAANGLPAARVVAEAQSLMEHAFSAVRMHAATLLGELGRETAIPALAHRLEREPDAAVIQSLERALRTLEAAPPPRLEIQMLGEFRLVRGDQALGTDEWKRPAVRRLFQYFALHAGQPLSRDRILDDLWPESEPQAARNTFRTIFSWLRRALDPYLRPKATARYFLVDGEVYCFAPAVVRKQIHSDMAVFEATVQAVLAQAEVDDLPQLPAEFLRVLENWSPLLPELPYEPWAVAARERVASLYVEGCLHAAQTLLHLQRAPEAAQWARKAIDVAPWLEEAYQSLMRAQARQGQRSPALRTYTETVDALQRELEVPPSALTEWLAQRLRQGEDI